MYKKFILSFVFAFACVSAFSEDRRIDFVKPFVGTDGFGNCYPGAQAPYGGIQISPDTDDRDYDCAAGYKYSKPAIQGFSLTHLSGTGIPDLGDFLFLPGVGEVKPSAFSHDTEVAAPGYYSVVLEDSGVKAEMAAHTYNGVLRFTYPDSDDAWLLIDLDHTLYQQCVWSSIRLDDPYTITGSKVVKGWNPDRYVFFALKSGQQISDFVILQDGKPVIYNTKRFRSNREAWGTGLQMLIRLRTKADCPVEFKVAVSGTGTDGALKNLQEPSGVWRGGGEEYFHKYKAEVQQQWEEELSKYTLPQDCSRALKETFYTSAYHTALHPFVFQDVDGNYRGHDKNIHKAGNFTNRTVLSLWDTYRAFHPLLNLVNQPLQADIANSMLAHFSCSTERMLPIWSFYGGETWCMIGYHAVSVLADMILKDVPGFDYEAAFQAMVTTASNPNYDCIPDYVRLGYVPFDKEKESVSKTLEYAYDDWCIAQVAKKLGHNDLYDTFIRRSENWRNLLDPQTGFMRGRDSGGGWRTPFAPVAYQGPGSVNGWGDITEGFTLQYTWSVPHNIEGYIKELGRDFMSERLDSLFTIQMDENIPGAHDIWGRIGGYWHGNEPCHHITYLYDWLGEPWKCQKWVRYVASHFYGNEPGSLSGNDDCGQMSAWYIFNCMGFYPVCPGSDTYALGSPCLPGMSVKLFNGNVLKITTENWSDDAVYVKEVRLGGRKLTEPFIKWSDLVGGGELHFVMSKKPLTRRRQG